MKDMRIRTRDSMKRVKVLVHSALKIGRPVVAGRDANLATVLGTDNSVANMLITASKDSLKVCSGAALCRNHLDKNHSASRASVSALSWRRV